MTRKADEFVIETPSDLWISSGHHLLDRTRDGHLAITDEFLKAYLARPEIVPPDDACDRERALHARLLAAPRAPVAMADVNALADRDARENWRHLVQFRDHLMAHPTIEGAYLSLARAQRITTPPLFLNQLVHLIARTMLEGERDMFLWRAAELLFRPQRLSMQDGVMLLADEEIVDGNAATDRASPLVAIFGDAQTRSLDVLSAANAPQYATRSDAFDMVLDFRPKEPGRKAFARVLERFIAHLTGARVAIEPAERFETDQWTWFVGLDQEATAIGNALWRSETPPDDGQQRIVALFSARVSDPAEATAAVGQGAFPLILAMTSGRIVRVKPQNLISGLPLRRLQKSS
jgi:hypothetical protein